jgi:hypothetical protein
MEVSLVRARLSLGLVATFLGLLAILQRGALARPPRARREPRPSWERRRPRLRARQRAARGDVGSVVRRAKGAAICQAEELRLDAYRSYVEPLLPDVSARVIDGVKRIGEGRPAADEATPASIDVHAVALRASHEPCKARGVHRAVPETTPSAPQLPPALDDEDWWEGKGFSRPGASNCSPLSQMLLARTPQIAARHVTYPQPHGPHGWLPVPHSGRLPGLGVVIRPVAGDRPTGQQLFTLTSTVWSRLAVYKGQERDSRSERGRTMHQDREHSVRGGAAQGLPQVASIDTTAQQTAASSR